MVFAILITELFFEISNYYAKEIRCLFVEVYSLNKKRTDALIASLNQFRKNNCDTHGLFKTTPGAVDEL